MSDLEEYKHIKASDIVEDSFTDSLQYLLGLHRLTDVQPEKTETISKAHPNKLDNKYANKTSRALSNMAMAYPLGKLFTNATEGMNLGSVNINDKIIPGSTILAAGLTQLTPYLADVGRQRNENTEDDIITKLAKLSAVAGMTGTQAYTGKSLASLIGNYITNRAMSSNVAKASPRETMPEWREHNRE